MMSVSLKKQMKMIEISDTFCPIVILSFIKISSDINSTMLGSIFEKKIMFMLIHCVKHAPYLQGLKNLIPINVNIIKQQRWFYFTFLLFSSSCHSII